MRPSSQRFSAVIAAFLGIIGLLVIAWGVTDASVDSEVPSRKDGAAREAAPRPVGEVQDPDRALAEALAWQAGHDAFLRRITQAAESAAEGDDYAERLVALFKERVAATRVLPGGVWLIMSRGDSGGDPRKLAERTPILLVAREEAGNLGHPPQSTFMFSNEGAFIFIESDPWSDWFLGVLAIHEMVHWDDLVISKREEPGTTYTEDWLMGEVRAHGLETAVLDRLTDGRLTEAIADVLGSSELSQAPDASGWRVPTRAGWRRLAKIWPDQPLSLDEQANRDGAVLIACLFAQGKSQRDFMEAYRWVLTSSR